MFTGIVQELGVIAEVRDGAEDRTLVVRAPQTAAQLSIGASVSIDGVCQTVTKLDATSFAVHAIAETLRVTTLGRLRVGAAVNLEPALGAGDPLGGHFVQGHVDGTGIVLGREALGDSIRMSFRTDPDLVAQLVPKGSVAIEGVSLTVGPTLDADSFEVFLIPHTLEVTTLGDRKSGDRVNLETDILGKYLWRFLGRDGAGKGIDWDQLRAAGFGGASGART